MSLEKWKSMSWRSRTLWILGVVIIGLSVSLIIMIIANNIIELNKNTGWEIIKLTVELDDPRWPDDIVFDSSGQVWIETEDGIYTGFKKGKQEHYRVIPDNDINIAIIIDSEDRLWIGSKRKLTIIDAITHELSPLTFPLAPEVFHTIAFDHLDRVWLGSWEHGIFVSSDESWTVLNTINSPLTNDKVISIEFDQQGRAWIGTGNGLQSFYGQDLYDTANWITFNTMNSDIAGNYIKDILVDDYGNIWIGTLEHGVSVYDGKEWMHYPNDIPERRSNSVVSMAADSNGRIYVVSEWNMMIIDDENVLIYDDNNSGYDILVRDIAIDSEGNVWISKYREILVAEVDDSGLPHKISQKEANLKMENLYLPIWIILEFTLIMLWLLVFINKAYVPITALTIGGSTPLLLSFFGITFSESLLLSIPIAICSMLGGIIGALIRKYLLDHKIISIVLIILGFIIGFYVAAGLFVGVRY
jgi:ligand-binding sensor domain-containing protein